MRYTSLRCLKEQLNIDCQRIGKAEWSTTFLNYAIYVVVVSRYVL